jgi:hypothetical protein
MAQIDQELRHSEIERGKLAALSHSYLQDPIEQGKAAAVKRLIDAYRRKETSHDVLVGIAAELSALDGLLDAMKNDIQRGETAFAMEHKHG